MNDAHITPPGDRPTSETTQSTNRVIVVGNEKGGAGKSTVSVHLAIGLIQLGLRVGIIDLDIRQRTLTRYLENRTRWIQKNGKTLAMPEIATVTASQDRDLDHAEREEADSLQSALRRLGKTNNIIIVDAPGSDTFLSRLAHQHADTLVTPMNDSFVDFDLLGDVDPETLDVLRPSFYSEMVWQSRKHRARTVRQPIDWIIVRNRMSHIEAKNKRHVAAALKNLGARIGFRVEAGLSERVIYRELFPAGLTLLDLTESGPKITFTMSHVAARQELRRIIKMLNLPQLADNDQSF